MCAYVEVCVCICGSVCVHMGKIERDGLCVCGIHFRICVCVRVCGTFQCACDILQKAQEG